MSKTVKSGEMQGGFKTNVYSTIREMFHDDNKETYVLYEDKYMRDCVFNFLKDLNYVLKSEQNAEEGCIYVNFEKGYFKTLEEEPNFEDKTFFEMPFDWSDFTKLTKQKFEENPIEKKEIVSNKNPEGWNEATTIGQNKESCGTMDKLKEAFKGGDYTDKVAETTVENKTELSIETKDITSIEQIKDSLHPVESNEHFEGYSTRKGNTITEDYTENIKEVDTSSHIVKEFKCDENYKIASVDFESGNLIGYMEIKKPFKAYINDYKTIEFIEFEDGIVYSILFSTPMESTSFGSDVKNLPAQDACEAVYKLVDFVIV